MVCWPEQVVAWAFPTFGPINVSRLNWLLMQLADSLLGLSRTGSEVSPVSWYSNSRKHGKPVQDNYENRQK